METMNISLPEPLKQFVDEQMAQERYSSVSEYIRELIRADERRKAEDQLEAFLLDQVNHAFITGPGGMGMTDLNSFADLPDGFVLVNARGINNQGQVFADIVPEPASYALMLAGLGSGRFHGAGEEAAGQ